MSFLMVIMWTIGDVYKTTYFIMRRAPMQFYICGMLQVGIRRKNCWTGGMKCKTTRDWKESRDMCRD